MDEEGNGEIFSDEFMKRVIEDGSNNPRSLITSLLPSHQATSSPSQEKTSQTLLKTLRKQKQIKHSQEFDHPDAISADLKTSELELFWDDNIYTNDDEAFILKLMMIQSMPLPMTMKRKHKQQLEVRYGSRVAKRSHHLQVKKPWTRVKERFYEIWSSIGMWRHPIKHIEGHFGTSIASYFVFIRLLLVLNFGILLIMITFIVLPDVLDTEATINYLDITYTKVENCSEIYQTNIDKNDSIEDYVLQFLQGTGWLEEKLMFIGAYKFAYKFGTLPYNMPLAYLLTTMAVLLVSLLFMLQSAAKGFKENAIASEGHLYNYCNTVFSSWDCCITKQEAAKLKQEMIRTELESCLEEERIMKQKLDRTRKEKFVLYSTRILINILILAMLGGAFTAIYEVSEFANNYMENKVENKDTDLLVEYLPSLTITGFNIVLPLLFYFLIIYEKYSPAFVININLGRTVFLRLVSIFMLLLSFKGQIESAKSKRCYAECIGEPNCKPQCWETYVGQQLYKLFFLDFVTAIVSVFGVGLLRMILVTKVKWKLFKMVGQEEFDLPKHVLDLVYSQTLCWLGAFFCPLLPIGCFVKCILFFYIKKFHLTVNCIPSRKPYRASKSNSFFMSVLLLSFGILVLVPLTYTVAAISPSRGCSPYRVNEESMWQIISEPISRWEPPFKDLIRFVVSAGFAIPIIIILFLFIYYNYTVAATYKKMSSVLKEHLLMEGRDKRFLLDRLTQVTQKLCKTELPVTSTDNLRKRGNIVDSSYVNDNVDL